MQLRSALSRLDKQDKQYEKLLNLAVKMLNRARKKNNEPQVTVEQLHELSNRT